MTVCEFLVVELSLLLDEVELLPEVLLLILVAVIVDSKSIAPSGVLHKNQRAGSRALTPETENYLKTGARLKGSCAQCTISLPCKTIDNQRERTKLLARTVDNQRYRTK